MDHQFRNATLGGFNKQDVLDYLTSSAEKTNQELQRQRESYEALEQELTARLAGKTKIIGKVRWMRNLQNPNLKIILAMGILEPIRILNRNIPKKSLMIFGTKVKTNPLSVQ